MTLKKIILAASLIELIIITVLVINVFINKDDVLGAKISINPINKENLIFSEEGDLKYFYEPKPNRIKSNKPEWLPDGYDYAITINADSLNERFDYSKEKDTNVFRIVTLGDSFTYGQYVSTKENYPERLEDMLNENLECKTAKKFEVINLGVGGYDIEYAVNRFKIRGEKYNPDLILWLVKNDDFFGPKELVLPKERQYEEEISADEDLQAEFYSKGSFYPWLVKAVQDVVAERGEEGIHAYNKKALERINDYYKGVLVFVTFSEWLKGSYLSMLQGFINARRDTFFYDGLSLNYDRFEDWHPTGKGYAQIADEIFDYLTQNGLIPCGLP